MRNKTFKERVQHEANNFSAIYDKFRTQYEAGLRETEARRRDGDAPRTEDVGGVWHYLFEIPFDAPEFAESTDAKGVTHRHATVIEVVRELGIHKLPLGALLINDPRISVALDAGLLDREDLVTPGYFDRQFQRLQPERDDPIFWRTLLEIFCRVFLASKGPEPWTLIQQIDLAFDLDEIRRTLLKGVWNEKRARKELNENPRYAEKYRRANSKAGQAAVGEDRIREVTAQSTR